MINLQRDVGKYVRHKSANKLNKKNLFIFLFNFFDVLMQSLFPLSLNFFSMFQPAPLFFSIHSYEGASIYSSPIPIIYVENLIFLFLKQKYRVFKCR